MNSYRNTILFFVALLSACAAAPKPPPPPAKPVRDMLTEIRAVGRNTASAVEVQPLRDPAIEGFVKQAETFEHQNRPDEALAELERALKLAPEAPELLQYRAELELALGRYAEAEANARRSFELGPKVGSLCARNWQTVVELRYLAKDMPSVDSAKAHVDQCKASGPVRM